MCIERLTFTSHQDVLEFQSVQMAAFLIEAQKIGYQDAPPIRESKYELSHSSELFYGYYRIDYQTKKLLGAIAFRIQSSVSTITRLVVLPSEFRKGIAKELMTFSLQWMQNENLHQVYVLAAAENHPAMQLYLSFGFTPDPVQQKIRGIPFVQLKKILQA